VIQTVRDLRNTYTCSNISAFFVDILIAVAYYHYITFPLFTGQILTVVEAMVSVKRCCLATWSMRPTDRLSLTAETSTGARPINNRTPIAHCPLKVHQPNPRAVSVSQQLQVYRRKDRYLHLRFLSNFPQPPYHPSDSQKPCPAAEDTPTPLPSIVNTNRRS